MAERSGGHGLTSHRGKYFDLRVKLFTGETFPVRDVYIEMKVRALKAKMEFVTGIPSHLQRLTYLDGADMMDDSDIKHHDIVPGATINLDVWYTWKTLIQVATDGETNKLLKLGVTKDSSYTTPSSQEMNERSKAAWLAERAFVALCIAAHRGHVTLVQKLIDGGANVHDKTPNGRTALHITAAQGKNNAVEVLLKNGATIEDPDNDGKNPLVLAGLWGHKSCERQIFLFQWQQRAAKQKPIPNDGQLLAHQMYDSYLKTWLSGDQAQIYYSQILPPGEYSGTGISAPKRIQRPSSAPTERSLDEVLMREMTKEGNGGISIRTESPRALRSAEAKKPGKGKNSSPFQEVKSKASGDKQSYDDWLTQKKATERRQAENKRKIVQQQKIKVEDEQRAVQEKEKSYETWLKEQKAEQKAAAKSKGKVVAGVGLQSRSPDRGLLTPDEKAFDLMKIRKEMDILHPVQVQH